MSLIDDIQLIEEVKKYPLLYDNKFRGYNSTKDKAWTNIAARLNVKPIEAKNRWRSLRDRFVREKKLLSSSSDSEQQKQRSLPVSGPWPLLDHMSFIWNFIVHRRRFTMNSIIKNEPRIYPSVASNKKDTNDTTEWVLSMDSVDDSKSSKVGQEEMKQDEPKSKKQSKRLLRYQQSTEGTADISDDERSFSPQLEQRLNTQSYVADEEHYFCMSVAETLRRFTSRQRAEAKLKIQQILYETEFEADATDDIAAFDDSFMG